MRNPLSTLALLLFVSRAAWGWTTVGDGIEYQSFTTSDPNNLFVARMERANGNAVIDASIANFKAAGARETVRNQCSRYDEELNWWGESYGNRNNVVVGINGDFFNTSTGLMTGGCVQGGWYVKRFTDFGGTSGFAWGVNRTLFIGDSVRHISDQQFVTFHASGSTRNFGGINMPPPTDKMTIFTPQYDTDTNTDNTATEVLVELTRPFLIMPEPGQVLGVIRQVRKNQGSTPIPFGHVVLSGNGSSGSFLASNAGVGDEVGISQEITNLGSGADWTKTYSSVGGNFTFLRNGNIQSTTNPGLTNLAPRTAIAYNATHVFFVVVDGRDPGTSEGMNMTQLASFCRNVLGATWGTNMDGGGSSTMVVNGQVMNNPSDGFERTVSNGVMMINLLPEARSSELEAGDVVLTKVTANLRLGPSTNYGVVFAVPANARGQVMEHSLNGILAKGYNWWKVQFGSLEGWMAGSLLDAPEPPGTVAVTDEGRWTPAISWLKASWTAAADNNGSGINRYEYAVGLSPGAHDVLGWTSAGPSLSVTASPVPMETGQTLYVKVRAIDNYGIVGEPGISDGITVPPEVKSIGEAWALEDGEAFALYTKALTRLGMGGFWLQERDRSAAVKVISSAALVEGSMVDVAGSLGPHGSHRVLNADVTAASGTGMIPLPLFMGLRQLGGAEVNSATPGVTDAMNLYNIGLLVRCWGVVTHSDSSVPGDHFFYIDDGSGISDGGLYHGVRVRCGDLIPPSHGFASVTGVVSAEAASAGVVPVLLVSDQSDISEIW